MSEEQQGHAEGGWLDEALGLDPHKSFTEQVADHTFGKDGPLGVEPDDSQLEQAGKALGIAATMPAWGPALFVGIGLDEINHAPLGMHGHTAEAAPADEAPPPEQEPQELEPEEY